MLSMLRAALAFLGAQFHMPVATYGATKLLDAVGNATTTGGGLPTADVWVKLHIGDPTATCTGSAAAETTRKQVGFAAASSASMVSNSDAAWTSVSTTETYSHISIWDNSSGGNALWYGQLSSNKSVTAGDNFTIPSGSLTLNIATT